MTKLTDERILLTTRPFLTIENLFVWPDLDAQEVLKYARAIEAECQPKKCVWKEGSAFDYPTGKTWETSCWRSMKFSAFDAPCMNFCPYCGGELEVQDAE